MMAMRLGGRNRIDPPGNRAPSQTAGNMHQISAVTQHFLRPAMKALAAIMPGQC